MRLRRRTVVAVMALTFALCSFSRLAAAADAPPYKNPPPQSEHLAYSVMLGGLHIGDTLVSFDQDSQSYHASLDMVASGALRLVKDFRASMQSEGKIADPLARPSFYRRTWTAGDIGEVMTMTFDPNTRVATTQDRVFNPTTGAQLTHEDLPWNAHHAKFTPVPDKLRVDVLDPMGAFISGRAQIQAKIAAGATFRVPVYDGSRRYDIVGKADAPRPVTISGVERTLLPVSGHIEPLFGFTKDGEEKIRNVQSKIYFTPDARFIPVQMIASNDYFSTVMNLTADCSVDADTCAALRKDLADHPLQMPPEQKADSAP